MGRLFAGATGGTGDPANAQSARPGSIRLAYSIVCGTGKRFQRVTKGGKFGYPVRSAQGLIAVQIISMPPFTCSVVPVT